MQAGVRVLPLFAVDKAADAHFGRVGVEFVCGNDAGADGREAVQTFAEIPLLVGGLHIAGGNVVQDGVAEHIVFCLPGGHIPGIFAQNHSQLAFVVQLLHKVSVSFNKAAVRHSAGNALGKINGILMFGCKGIGRVFLRFVRVGHVVDAKAHHILRRAGNRALQLHGIHGQGRDARNGKLQACPHLRGQKGDGIGQGFIGKAQPAQRPDLCAVRRKNGRIFYAVRQAAGDKTHFSFLPQWR